MDNSLHAYQWVLDAGNTSIKSGLFLNEECVEIKHWTYPEFNLEWSFYWEKWHQPLIAFCSVGNPLPLDFVSLGKALATSELEGWKWEYETKASLGVDRIAAVLGATHLYPSEDKILVVDMGTCVTYTLRDGQENWITYFCQLYHVDRVVLTGSDVVHLEIDVPAKWDKIPYLNLHGLKAWMDA